MPIVTIDTRLTCFCSSIYYMKRITRVFLVGSVCDMSGDVHVKCHTCSRYWTNVYMNNYGVPAEFKHIDKRRRMYNIEYCQSLRMNAVYITIGIVVLFNEMLHRMYCQRLGGFIRFVIPSE